MSFLDKIMLRTSGTGSRPPAAVEIAPEGVLAAALTAPNSADTTLAFEALPAGAVTPGIAEPNLRQPEAITAAVKSALDQVAPRSHSVTVIVPDTAVRVFVLDFDSLPAKADDALPVLRFRLRKIVPFDAEQAAVSYQILSDARNSMKVMKVLVIITPSSILTEYESAVRAAGYEPGAVLPTGLAALAALEGSEPALTAILNAGSLTTAITRGNDLLLYRTVELPATPEAALDEIRRGVAVSAAYFEDQVGAKPARLLYSGTAKATEFGDAVAENQLTVEEIAPEPATGAMTAMGQVGFAGVTGALKGAA